MPLNSCELTGTWVCLQSALARVCLSIDPVHKLLLQISAVRAFELSSSRVASQNWCQVDTGKLCSAELVAVHGNMCLLDVFQVRHLRSRSSPFLGRLHELALALESQV